MTRSNIEDKTTLMMELTNKADELALNYEYQLRLEDMNHSQKIKVCLAFSTPERFGSFVSCQYHVNIRIPT